VPIALARACQQRRKTMKNNHVKYITAAIIGVGAITLGSRGMQVLHAKESASEPVPPLVHKGEQLLVPEKSPLRKALDVVPVAGADVSTSILLPAVVEADPARLVKVLPPLSGRIVSMNKHLGDEVKVGDVLFTIDSADLAQASADAGKAQAALSLARRNLDRQSELDRSDIAAKRDLDQARSDYESASSEAARAQARLSQLGAGKGAGSGHALAVRSPLAGRVTDLSAAAGAYWNDATAPVMTVADLSQVFITANAQEKDLGAVFAGQSASVKLDAYPEAVLAKVSFVGEMLDPDTRTVKIRMAVANRDGKLKPGMFAEASLFAKPHNGILVPMTAVVQSGFDSHIYVESTPWTFTARTVTLGAQAGDNVEITGGLKAGERIVIKNGVLLND